MPCKNKCGNETIHGRQICEECDKKDRELLDQIKNLGERSEPPHPLLSDVADYRNQINELRNQLIAFRKTNTDNEMYVSKAIGGLLRAIENLYLYDGIDLYANDK